MKWNVRNENIRLTYRSRWKCTYTSRKISNLRTFLQVLLLREKEEKEKKHLAAHLAHLKPSPLLFTLQALAEESRAPNTKRD